MSRQRSTPDEPLTTLEWQKSTPAERLRDSLLVQKGNGVHFDIAWSVALEGALPSHERRDWREALVATRPDWERAYNREQTAFAKAILDP